MKMKAFNFQYHKNGHDFIKENHKVLRNYVKALCLKSGILNKEDINDIFQEVMIHLSQGWAYDPTHEDKDKRTAKISTYLYTFIIRSISKWRLEQRPEPKTQLVLRNQSIIESENLTEDVVFNLRRFYDYLVTHPDIGHKQWLLVILFQFCKGFIGRHARDQLRKMKVKGPHTRAISDMWMSKLKKDLWNLAQEFIKEGHCLSLQGVINDRPDMQPELQ